MPGVVAHNLASELRRRGLDVDDSPRRRAEYSTDASNYRVAPQMVAFPRHRDEVVELLDAARQGGVAVTSRGGGTSVAGNAVGTGLVIDFSRHLHRILDIDPVARTARVEPGVVHATLQREAAPHGLRFGPDPSTSARCTFGGMIGNNACGPRALAYGRTADNVRSLDVIDGTGRRFVAGEGLEVVPGLGDLVTGGLSVIRTELGGFDRQGSGYSLEHLAPERGSDLAKALVGTEGTCVTMLEATIDLVTVDEAPVLVVLGYPDMAAAADAVPALLAHRPIAMEGLDGRIVGAVVEHRGASAVPPLPTGRGWLFVEIGGRDVGDALRRARELVGDSAALGSRILPPGPEARSIWRMREDGAGLAGRTSSGRQAWPGIEDAAVPPERLGDYLRDFERLMTAHDLDGMPYGHFGDGCVHVRIDFPLDHDTGVFRSFMEEAADLIVGYGGSLSGEHGDGRARGELLARMYSPDALRLFAQFKGLFDPTGVLNPGVLVDPVPLDADLRRPQALPILRATGFAFAHDGGDLANAVHRCVGVGKCRADLSDSGGFMCPSFLATRDEKDSTRGRARVLQEAIVDRDPRRWRSAELEESLDLCLSCKACASDCPAGVDMAALKSETLHRRFRGRIRPIAHYSLGWMPRWARLATLASGPVNALLAVRWVSRAVLALGGMDSRRRIPAFAGVPFRRWWRKRRGERSDGGPEVMLWVDTFSDNFSPELAIAATGLLEAAGFRVRTPEQPACCGLTWISTGQLDGARRRLLGLLDALGPAAEAGLPIVGLEPSCTAVLRSDLVELLPGDPRARAVAGATRTLAEVLTALDPEESPWRPPDLSGTTVVVQPHCHQHAVMGFEKDLELLRAGRAEVVTIAGCCGLAGNFGMERGHYEISAAVAQNGLLPALASAPEGSVFLADGMSCRTQADQLAGIRGIHLAQLLAG